MELADWLKERGRGAATELARQARVSPEAVRLAAQKRLRRLPTAKAISDATDGAVPTVALLDASMVGRQSDVPAAHSQSMPDVTATTE